MLGLGLAMLNPLVLLPRVLAAAVVVLVALLLSEVVVTVAVVKGKKIKSLCRTN
jgi:hypothetical protein